MDMIIILAAITAFISLGLLVLEDAIRLVNGGDLT